MVIDPAGGVFGSGVGMGEVLTRLKEVHELRVDRTKAQVQLRRGPLELKRQTKEVEACKAAIAAAEDELKHFRTGTKSKELTLKQGDARIEDLKVKLNGVKTNKEYAAIKDEIARIQASNGNLEEEILELFNDDETKQADIGRLKEDLAKSEQQLAEQTKIIEYKLEKLKGQIELLDAKIDELERNLGPAQADYRRLVKTKGDAGIAACVDATCQACFSAVTPQLWDTLRCDKPVLCNNCGALLYTG